MIGPSSSHTAGSPDCQNWPSGSWAAYPEATITFIILLPAPTEGHGEPGHCAG